MIEQRRYDWFASENYRKAGFCVRTTAGRKRLALEATSWRQMIPAVVLSMGEKFTADGDTRQNRNRSFRRKRVDVVECCTTLIAAAVQVSRLICGRMAEGPFNRLLNV